MKFFMRCQKHGGLYHTTGDDSMAEYHARRCDCELVKDEGCHAVIYHGPGHQSSTRCRVKGEHIHEAVYGEFSQFAEWTDPDEICSGFFDEPPRPE